MMNAANMCETHRLDPYAGTQSFEYAENERPVAVRLSREGAVMKRRLTCGLDVSLALPTHGFEGVAARAVENADGTCTVTLVLRHADPQLSVPLMASRDAEAAAADWRSWARTLRLPMLLDGVDGLVTVEDEGVSGDALRRSMPRPRRRSRTTLKHRPNFNRRRKAGRIGPVARIEAREIIARN